MTTDNKPLWKSTIVVALIASAQFMLASFRLKGMWVIDNLDIILWLFWLGVLLGDHIKVRKWQRCLAFIFGFGLVICTAIPSLEVFFPKINWFMFGYMLLGLSVPIDSQSGTMSLKESGFLCILFGLIYCSCTFLSRRSLIAIYECPGDLTNHIHSWIYSLKAVPLLGLNYCFLQLVTNEKIQKLVDNNVIKWGCIGVCIVTFILHIAELFYLPDWDIRSYRLFQLALCPMVFIIIECIARKRDTLKE